MPFLMSCVNFYNLQVELNIIFENESRIFRTFANETAQFLAPFEAQGCCRRSEEMQDPRQEFASESFLNNKVSRTVFECRNVHRFVRSREKWYK